MYAAIKYEDDEIKSFHDQKELEDYKIILRLEVSRFAKGRTYELYVRDNGNTIFHFKSK